MRSVHVIAKPASSAINGEEPVLVYDSKEFACKSIWNNSNWFDCRIEGSFRDKEL